MSLSSTEYRCRGCRKLLFKGVLIDSKIEIKCKGCHEMNIIKSSSKNEFICAIRACPSRVTIT